MLIIPSSWGSPTSSTSTPSHQVFFWHRCRGTKKKKLPRQHRTSKHFSGAVAGESRTSSQGESLITNLFTLLFLFCLVSFCFVCLFCYKKTQKISLSLLSYFKKHKKIKSPLVVASSLAHHVGPQIHLKRPSNW